MKNRWLLFSIIGIIGVIITIIVFYSLGFRITYAPELENNWTAIDAVGTWVGVLSPILLAIINAAFAKKIERTKNEISSSNRVIFEQSIANKETPIENSIQSMIQDYITVSITVSTEKIAIFTKMDLDELFDLLCKMEINNIIESINKRSNVEKKDVVWKIARSKVE